MKLLSKNKQACLALVLLSGALLGTPSQAESKFSIADGKTTTKVPFELIDNRVFVEVQLNGRGPFHFILDTGAGDFAIVDDVAQRLGLQVEDAGQENGVGEKKVRIGRTQIAKVQLGDLRFEDLKATVLPNGDSGNVFGKKPVDGIVGLDLFQQVVVSHDYIHMVLTFTLPDKFNYRGPGVIVHFDRPRQIPVVDAELDGVRGKFGIDTGARSSLLAYGPFVDQNKLKEKYDAKLEGVTGWGIGGPVRSLLARAKELRIGEVVVRDLVIRLSIQKAGLTTSSAMAGLIGPDVLSQFDLTVDYSHDRLIFEKNKHYGRRDSYDRAGMWMGEDGEHFAVVDVIAGGPADEAGIKQGESILAIDGVSIDKLVLPEVRDKIRHGPIGKRITLLLESNGKRRTAVVTLRDIV
ncbi:MAG TPA: aspartyl protease family protein [Candidatus Eremiobacteraceae bacterium]|nr:aspartyl protease family protein [Candidatus Eremiobacteraceae bacterium]